MALTNHWMAAEAAAPEGWTLQGLRCGSTGLDGSQRSDRWVAEACGPDGACERVELDSPEQALQELAQRLRRR